MKKEGKGDFVSKLFQPGAINGLEIKNRFVRSATWEGMAGPGGEMTPRLLETMVDLARGGVGLIITSHTYVSPEGQAMPGQLGVYKDDLVDGLKSMTAAVQEHGAKTVLQLAHAGALSLGDFAGTPPLAVSVFEGLSKTPRHEMTKDDLQGLVQAFAAAATRAKAAGFDGVQIHAAHGYLLSQFLTPHYNRRQDGYGGDIKNRSRIILEVLQAVREAVGKDFPVLIKLNSRDDVENGLTLDDSLQTAALLARAGLDAVELSGGHLTGGRMSPSRMVKSPDQEAYFQEEARAFKKTIDLPLILVGGNRSLETSEVLVNQGVADYISMSRPFIREPDLVKRWQAGDRRPALCRSDNACFKPGMEGKGIYCVTAEREKSE